MVLDRGAALRQPILAPEVESQLIRAWKERGDGTALERITRAYARLCYSIAATYTKDENRMQDLAQEGSFGIRKAVEHYDPTRGTRFSTYSRLWIKNHVAMAASGVLGDITVPARAFNDARMGRLEAGTNDHAVMAAMPFVMLDAPVGDEEGAASSLDLYVREDVTPESLLEELDTRREARRVIWDTLAGLTDREREIVRRRKLKDPADTLEQISEDFGVTRERIRQVEAIALARMKELLIESGFDCRSFFLD